MENALYWLWVQKRFGAAKDIAGVIAHFGSAEKLYKADKNELDDYFKGRHNIISRLLDKSLAECEEIIDTCKKYGIHILTPDSALYPKSLLEIENYPAVLFVRGDVNILANEPAFAVIGSRTPSKYGAAVAAEIVSGLTEKVNALIVSGGALGIDSVAHKAAIESGGKTVLVTGNGFGDGYLPENSDLRKSVSKNGALISEYPPFSPVGRGTFPQRNRIISGISKAVVIIEAGARSGTFSTARHAVRQKKDLFVLPGDVLSGNFEGSNQLIREGATEFFSSADILSRYYEGMAEESVIFEKSGNPFPKIDEEYEYGKKAVRRNTKRRKTTVRKEKKTEKKENIEKNLPQTISKNAEIVYNIMSDGALSLDEIKKQSSLETRKVLTALTELELEGIAESDGPNMYRLI